MPQGCTINAGAVSHTLTHTGQSYSHMSLGHQQPLTRNLHLFLPLPSLSIKCAHVTQLSSQFELLVTILLASKCDYWQHSCCMRLHHPTPYHPPPLCQPLLVLPPLPRPVHCTLKHYQNCVCCSLCQTCCKLQTMPRPPACLPRLPPLLIILLL